MTNLDACSKWFAVIGVTLSLISEAGTYIALLLSAICCLVARRQHRSPNSPAVWNAFFSGLKTGRFSSWLILAVVLWFLEGLLAAALNGHLPRGSHLYKALLALVAVVGYSVLPALNQVFWRRFVLSVLVSGALAACAGGMQYKKGAFLFENSIMSVMERADHREYRGQLYIPGTKRRAATGPLRNRIKTSTIILWTLALVMSLTVVATKVREKLALLALTLLFLGFSVLTFANAGLGAAACGLSALGVGLVIPKSRAWLAPALTAAFVMGTISVVTLGLQGPLDAGALAEAGKLGVRSFAWAHGLLVLGAYPLMGSGFATYSRVAPDFFVDPVLTHSHTINAHCQHLTTLAEGGVLGFLPWVLVLILIGRGLGQAWQVESKSEDLPFRAMRVGATFVMVALLPVSFVHDPLFHPSVAALFWLTVGVVGYVGTEATRRLNATKEMVSGKLSE